MKIMTSLDFSSLVFFGDSLTDNGNLFALNGQPGAPYVNGRFSNGPTYAEILPGLLGIPALNFAFGGAEAADNGSPGEIPLINLTAQVNTFLASLPPTGAPDGTAAVLNIGNNDYLRFAPASPAEVPAFVGQVVGAIGAQAQRLLAAGVDKIILFTLPSVAVTPLGASLPPDQVAGAQAIIEAHNAGIGQLAAGLGQLGVNAEVVDIFRLAQELGADQETFGFKTTSIPVVAPGPGGALVPTGIDQILDADEIAFFDAIHPTAAAHQVQAIFAETSLNADRVLFGTGSGEVINGRDGSDLIFGGAGNDRLNGGRGDDVLFAGLGNDVVHGGEGNDIIAGGSGDDLLQGVGGDDLLAGNLGNDRLQGGNGNDVLIGGQGFDILQGGGDDDLIILDIEALIAGQAIPGAGRTLATGGTGTDTIRFAFDAGEFNAEIAGEILDAGLDLIDPGHNFAALTRVGVLGADFREIERIEISVGGEVVATLGAGPGPSGYAVTTLLAQADLWGLV